MLDNLPTLDLHGEYKESAIILTDEFINDNIVLKNSKIVVVHGLGSDILRKSLHEHLKHDKRVKEFYLDPWNIGQTIVHLNTKKI